MQRFFFLLLIFILMGAGCAFQDTSEVVEESLGGGQMETTLTIIPEPNPNEVESNTIVDGVKEVELEVTESSFKPGTISVKKGQLIRITPVSVEGVHTFVFEEADVKVKIEEGEVIEFYAPEVPEIYSFFSDVHNDRKSGMGGLLFVKDL